MTTEPFPRIHSNIGLTFVADLCVGHAMVEKKTSLPIQEI
jgi:hypothetical protein